MKQKYNFKRWISTLIALFVAIGFSMDAQAQIAAWDFTGASSVATWEATTFNTNISSSNLVTRGPGAAASAGGNSFRTTGFQNDGIAVTNTDYFQVTLSPAAGYTLSLSTIDVRVTGTTTFANAPGVSQQFAFSTNGTTFTLIGSPFVTIGTNQTASVDVSEIAALQDVEEGTTIYLRYYASGQTTTGGWGFFSNTAGNNGLAISGSVDLATADPVLSAVPATISGLEYLEGFGPSASSSFNLTGANLDNTDVIISAPANFEVSLDDVSFGASRTLPAYNGAATTVHVRLVEGLDAGDYSGTIEITGGGTVGSTDVAVSGEVTEPAPPLALPYYNGLRIQDDFDQAVDDGFTFSNAVFASAAGGRVDISSGGYIETPALNLSLFDKIGIYFDLRNFGSGSGRELTVRVAEAPGGTFTDVKTIAINSTSEVTYFTLFDVVGAIDSENAVIRFEMTGGTGGIRFRELTITGDIHTTTIGGLAGWRALSLPVGNIPITVLASQNQVQGITGIDTFYGTSNFNDADSNVVIWANTDEDQFRAPASSSTRIQSGQGFGWYFFNNNDTPFSQTLPFDLSVAGASPTDDITRTLSTENDFTFLGNPYDFTLSPSQVTGANDGTIAAAFFFYDPTTNNFVGDVASVDPFTGFFVEKLTDGDVTILFEDPIVLSEPQFAEVRFNLVGMDGDLEVIDNATRLLFHENATFEFDRYDLSKLRSLHYQFANISFIGEKFGNPVNKMIDSYPLALDDAIEVMMSLDVVNFSGEFTLSADMVDVPEGWTITLTDNLTGETVNLRNQVYTFSHEGEASTASALDFSQVGALQTNDPEGRFTVVVNPVTTSAPVNNELPTVFALNQNYPNPFNPTTQISYDLPETAEVRLDVFNIQGQRVATLVNTTQNAGTHRINFDGANLSSGVYIYRLTAGANVLTKKMTLIK